MTAIEAAWVGLKNEAAQGRDCSDWIRVLVALGVPAEDVKEKLAA